MWKTVQTLLSDRIINSEKIHLNKNGWLINSESETVEVVNEFFSNIVIQILKMLKIQFLRQFWNIIEIEEKSKNSKFTFHEDDNEKVIKEI